MNVFEKTENFVMKTYNRFSVNFVKGEGCWLYDDKDKKYLDMLAGIAVCNLGHCHPTVSDAICEQARKLIHVSNLFHIETQAELAELICKNSFGEKVFFCNSGAEANEGAIKLARRYGTEKNPEKYEIVAFRQSFHGRTMAAVSITGQGKYNEGFGPMLRGVKFAEFNNLDSVKEVVSDKTAGIIVEPIQGEGGIVPADKDFLLGLRKIADEIDAILIFDEVQTGIGRTGKLFAYQHYGIEPDVMTLAKALGNGVPIGAIVAKGKAADVLKPGLHASTFGGNPLATRAGIEVIKIVSDEEFLKEVERKGKYLAKKLEELKGEFSEIINFVRGKGLMLGAVCKIPCSDIVKLALEKGLIINCTAGNVLRFVPPLVITEDEIDYGIKILKEVLKEHAS
ncbi:Acetylornithine/succinyldiaminopimelate aminotransferase [Desulfurobacterium thermolithotrophum DSM 11699]|uniref:Acetylornithine aminotransferase n=1 Tax=Desulfurobacterium thermolithotrophum (strain DSM 11699 / BSA) TaxID=868864 RepID=F0S3J7_DESTD|nr:aspartate aminotransferase family protein [Desulfurobacterium thermolithotrophum]ADY73419.1 Acetylornithine/succinyldiaminopimelate aminotransferase [Desulfurobacterium thermolithotrophum DSM 11699]